MLGTPCFYFCTVCNRLAAHARLSLMSLTSCGERGFCQFPARLGTLGDAFAFHIRYLRQHGNNQFAYAVVTDLAEAVDFQCNAFLEQCTDGSLYVDSVTAQTVNSVHMHGVTRTNIGQHFSEAGAVG